MSKTEAAVSLFDRKHNCCQAVFAAYGPELGVEEPVCLALASTLGGGIARQAETCGAVTGALMALGLRHGAVTIDHPEEKARAYAIGQEFIARFKAKNGSITCRELLGCDISTPEGAERMKELGLGKSRCRPLVRDAAEILADML